MVDSHMTEHLNGVAPIDANDEYETITVTLDNVAYVAMKSGKDEQALRGMMLLKHRQGQDLKVRYKVVPTPKKRKFWRKNG